jgi:hypothetical protein
MSIDPQKEQIFLLSEANSHSPGKAVSRQAWWRRALKGIRANGVVVKLDSLMYGRERYTSKEAIQRFIAAQNPTSDSEDVEAPPVQRRRQADAARNELAEMGV